MQIDKDVPMPPMVDDKVNKLKSMEIGDSVLVSEASAGRWRGAMQNAQKRGEFYFISRAVDGGVRIWRKA